MQHVQEIINDMKMLKKYFDYARVVDPLCKTVSQIKDEDGNEVLEKQSQSSCYDIWGRNHSCLNCISMRAINENDTFVKFEDMEGRAFMISAVPIKIDDRLLAIELFKDVTQQKILDGILHMEVENIDMLLLRSSVARLNEIVVRDTLTQLYNRKYINEKLPVDMMKAVLEKSCLSVVMVDIDHFKKVNDTYGHLVGDEILQMFAQILQKHIRHGNGDWVARYGGEEFLICLMDCDKQSAKDTAKRIRQVVEEETYNTNGGILKITASFGIQTMAGQEIDMLELIRLADENLSAAKQAGRNQVAAG